MEFNLLTVEVEGVGDNITATIKNMGKGIVKFNCKTKHLDTALEGFEEVIGNLNLNEAIKLSDFEPEVCVNDEEKALWDLLLKI